MSKIKVTSSSVTIKCDMCNREILKLATGSFQDAAALSELFGFDICGKCVDKHGFPQFEKPTSRRPDELKHANTGITE